MLCNNRRKIILYIFRSPKERQYKSWVSISSVSYEYVTIYTRRDEILLLAGLCQGIGIQCPVLFLGKVLFMQDLAILARYYGCI